MRGFLTFLAVLACPVLALAASVGPSSPMMPEAPAIMAAATWQEIFPAGTQNHGGVFQNTSAAVEYICLTGCSGGDLGSTAIAVYPASATNPGIFRWGPVSGPITVYGAKAGQTYSAFGG
ncbi:hypothetical protein [Novacetimonas hansenii]|uniref:hypothetical protein n=1 Tax=Novacetimonas hansenii TaxID=436 RepID=UPI00095030C1|nr:hypothetical protein [Novacetimonas hansenii]